MVCSLTNRMTLINVCSLTNRMMTLMSGLFVDRSDDNTDFMFAHWPIRRWPWWMVCLLTNQMMALMNRLLVDQSDDDTDEWFARWPIRWWHWRMGCSMTKRSGDDSRECFILGQTNDCSREYFMLDQSDDDLRGCFSRWPFGALYRTDLGKCNHLYDGTQGNNETQALSTENCLLQVQEDR